MAASAALNFTMNTLAGKPVNLAEKYQGKVVLLVNVASKCGLTPQYKGLQALHDNFAAKGLSIVGVPANNFGAQEPGTNEQIGEFCSVNYGVKFDMLAKVSVKGDDKCDLYKYLTSPASGFPGEIGWNFAKFLVGRDGKVAGRFDPQLAPEDSKLVSAIEAELAKAK